ncbi:MAG: [LysW]-aminoadipate/[LysW]-glutamate kinase [Thermoplasmataceae archaeon]
MTTVIKLGGSLMRNGVSQDLINDLASQSMKDPIIVHGGGPSVTDLCIRLGIEPKFIHSPQGIRSRYTDLETMEVYIMAMRGKVNSSIVLSLQKAGINAVGMSGIDGQMIIAERKKRLITINGNGRRMYVDGGYTGKITRVDPEIINSILSIGKTPVIAPIAISQDFEALNVDADRAASAIAGTVKAERLILLTDVDGVLINGELVESFNIEEAKIVMKDVGNGMDKKIMGAIESMESGTREVIIANGNAKYPISRALNSNRRTVIRK